MRAETARLVAEYELEKFPNLIRDGWKIETTGRSVSRLGVCYFRRKLIVISSKFAVLNTADTVVKTVRHEIAHALVGPTHGHDLVWQAQAIALGISPARCNTEAIMPDGKWIAICVCGQKYHRQRQPKLVNKFNWPVTYSCRKCNTLLAWQKNELQLI